MRLKMIVAALVLWMTAVMPLVGCANTDSDRAYGVRGDDVGQAGYPKAPWGNNNGAQIQTSAPVYR